MVHSCMPASWDGTRRAQRARNRKFLLFLATRRGEHLRPQRRLLAAHKRVPLKPSAEEHKERQCSHRTRRTGRGRRPRRPAPPRSPAPSRASQRSGRTSCSLRTTSQRTRRRTRHSSGTSRAAAAQDVVTDVLQMWLQVWLRRCGYRRSRRASPLQKSARHHKSTSPRCYGETLISTIVPAARHGSPAAPARRFRLRPRSRRTSVADPPLTPTALIIASTAAAP